MLFLLEALWYGLLIVIEICWIPAVIILGIALLSRLFGKIRKACKDSKK